MHGLRRFDALDRLVSVCRNLIVVRGHMLCLRVHCLLGIGCSQRLRTAQGSFCIGQLVYRNAVGVRAGRVGVMLAGDNLGRRLTGLCRVLARRVSVRCGLRMLQFGGVPGLGFDQRLVGRQVVCIDALRCVLVCLFVWRSIAVRRIGKLPGCGDRYRRVAARCGHRLGRGVDIFVHGGMAGVVDRMRCRRVQCECRIMLGLGLGQLVHGNRRVVRLRLRVFGILRRCGRVGRQRAGIQVLRQILRIGQFDRGIAVVHRGARGVDIVQLVQERLRRPLRFRQGVHQRAQALGQRCERRNQRRIGA